MSSEVLRYSVKVAQQPLTLLVGVRIPVSQPYCKTKKDATRKTGDFLGFSRFSSVLLTFSKIEFMCK